MAKEISLTDALAVLANAGVSWNEEQKKVLAEAAEKAARQPAIEVFIGNGENLPGKLNETDDKKRAALAEKYVDRFFALAADVSNDIAGDFKKIQGGAEKVVHVVGIETPFGHLQVLLKRNPS